MIALAAAQGLGVALSPAFIVHDALRRGDPRAGLFCPPLPRGGVAGGAHAPGWGSDGPGRAIDGAA